MNRYRHALPQIAGRTFLTDGGLETTLIFHDGIDLPYFAAFDLLKDAAGMQTLRRYYRRYAELARESGLGLVLESPTWRASSDWGVRLGYDADALATANRQAIALMSEMRRVCDGYGLDSVISGNLGPRGDGYVAGERMTTDAARRYHAAQIETFAGTEADMVAAFTINYPEEAIGIALAARDAGMPVAISFTVETDGGLHSGDALGATIERCDRESDGWASYYMINCAHPSHFEHAIANGGAWRERIGGLRANASRRSHAELDEATDLDDGDPQQLGAEYRSLRTLLPKLSVAGGCCGTDHRHVAAIAVAVASG